MSNINPYPFSLESELDPDLSRWLWLIKWVLVITHYIVLTVLWNILFFLTVVAVFGILFTRKYPTGMFDFNAGVLRWTWRVGFYSYNTLGHRPVPTL